MSADLVPTEKLKQRQLKIQEKRKKTEWRDFLMEIASWQPVMLYKNQWFTSRYPETTRTQKITSIWDFSWKRENMPFCDIWSSSLLTQYQELSHKIPNANVLHDYINENADFSDICYGAKNSYLSFSVWNDAENVMYSNTVNTNVNNILDSFQVYNNSDNVASSVYITESSNVYFSQNIHASHWIRFSKDCIGSSNLILCSWLTNKSYCIENIEYSPDEFMKKKKEILEQKKQYFIRQKKAKSQYVNIQSTDSEGIWLVNCSNIYNGYFANACSNGHNVCIVDGTNHSDRLYDCFSIWLNCYDCYGFILWWTNCEHIYCSTNIGTCTSIYYSNYLNNCSFCLWCIWLKNKSYCIFNKQYTKDERYDEVDKMFTKMEKDWQLWEFFPGSMNPFYFNDTAAYLIDPSFTKEEVTAKWYLRRDEPIKVDIPVGSTLVSTADLDQYEWFDSEWNRTINADILKVVIQDEQDNYYRIIPMEYKFLVKHGLPLPRKHWLERMKDSFKIG